MTTASPRFPRHTFNPAADLQATDGADKSFGERGRALTQLLLGVLDTTPLFSFEVDAILGTDEGWTNARTKAHTSTRPQQEIEFRTRLSYLIEAYRGTLPVPGALTMEQTEWCDRVFKTLAYFMELDGVEHNVALMIRGVRTFVDPWPVQDMKADDPGYYAQVWRFLFPPLDCVADPSTFSIMEEMEALFATVECPWQHQEDAGVKSRMPNSAEALEQRLVTAFLARGRNWHPLVRVPYAPVLDPLIQRFLRLLDFKDWIALHILVTNPQTSWPPTVLQETRGDEHTPPSIEAAERWLKVHSYQLGNIFVQRYPHLRGIVRSAHPDEGQYSGLVMTTDPAVFLQHIKEPPVD